MILSDCACVRVQFADIAGEIASEPDVAFLVGCETVRPRLRGLCPILTESSRPWIEPPENARHLTRVPNCTVRRGKRVVRMRALCRHCPFCERDVRLRQRPQRSNSGDRQKTKKCGDRRGHNSSPHLKSSRGFVELSLMMLDDGSAATSQRSWPCRGSSFALVYEPSRIRVSPCPAF